ncbi:MAG TPA: 2-phospho-L-lactate transferase CofD family protein [Bryobacteraceae bacterium]
MLITYDHLNSAQQLAPATRMSPVDVEPVQRAETSARAHPSLAQLVPVPLRDATLRVVVFCGGRGSSTIIRELIRWPQVDLSLLVNAYDDGLSTGELREFIPSMLGPSDFRKNLSQLLDFCSSQQYALQKLLELRLPNDFSAQSFERLTASLANHSKDVVMPEVQHLFEELDPARRTRIIAFLEHFAGYFRSQHGRGLRFSDCSFGNLIFAGCYLECGQSFNATVKALSELFGSKAHLINVSRGEDRILAALKRNGEILSREAEIVGPQSSSPIRNLFFLEKPLSEAQKQQLANLGFEEKADHLARLSSDAELSPEAEQALLHADLVIYGPGTQFSSLLPSYRIARDAIRRSSARAKIFVANLEWDHDIQTLTALDLADRVLEMAGDPRNENLTITHIFYNRDSRRNGIPLGITEESLSEYKSARIVAGQYANPARPNVHSGYQVVRSSFAVLRSGMEPRRTKTLDVYVDLLDRSMAIDFLLQEFMELPWRDCFDQVRLRINRLKEMSWKLPEHLRIEPVEYAGLFSDVDVFHEWLENGDSEFLVTLTGDGEYRLSDLLLGIQVCDGGVFGAVFGSRTQSRRQFRSSLRAAYGERGFLHAISGLGALVFIALFALRFRVVLSDPLTGFRMYQRSKLNEAFREAMRRECPRTTAGITRLMAANHVEIAEVPVSYRTFDNFTKPGWRLWRGVRNLLGSLV